MGLSFYSTSTLVSAVDQMTKPKSFLRDRYFPCNPAVDIFNTEYVLIEIKNGSKKLAPFVTPLKGGVLMKRDAVRMEQFVPPTVAPARVLSVDDLKKRGFGEALYANLTPEQRAQQLTLMDISDLNDMITRREEKVASDILFTNKCIMKHITDDPTKTEDCELDFTNDGDNKALYTPSTNWTEDTPFSAIELDIYAMVRQLTSRGLPASDMLLGLEAALVLKNNKEFVKRLDIEHLDAGALKATEGVNGATLLGSIVVMGHKLNLFTYDEEYEDDETGELKQYIPTRSICITAPAAGHSCYGSTILLEGAAGEEEPVNYAAARVPQYLANRKSGIREVVVHSHPLLLPHNVDPWVFAEVISD